MSLNTKQQLRRNPAMHNLAIHTDAARLYRAASVTSTLGFTKEFV